MSTYWLSGCLAKLTVTCYYHCVKSRRKIRSDDRPVFDSIRKPTAPPSKKMGQEKPEERLHPALRKVKHKTKLESEKDQ